MKKLGLLGGFAALILLVFASTQASANGRYGWSSDYSGNEWIGENIRSSKSSDDDEAPQKKSRVVKAKASDNDEKPVRKVRRRSVASSDDDSPSGSSFQSGIASYYWQPQPVASGGWYNPNAMTAAHKTLPFGTKVRVTHRGTGRSVVVTINDRGPYIAGRVIDLSVAAAGRLGMKGAGLARVELAVLGR